MIKFEDSVIDVYGEEKYKLLTINVDNKTVGYIDYSVFEENPYIKYIEVKDEYRRKGYGKKLIEKLQSLYPDSEIDFGMMTDDGSKLYKSLKKEIIPNKDYPKKIQYLEKINNWLKKYGSICHKDLDDWTEEDIAYLRKYADIWKKYHDKQQDIEDWLNNNKKQIVKIKHNLNESWTDSYDLYDIYENYQPYNVLMEFENGEKNIWFPLIKPSEYKQALLEFMKMGELVRFPKDKVFKWLEIIMKNTCIIDAITSLAGHTAWFPYDDCRNVYDELEDAETDFYIFSDFLDNRGFYDWCKLPDGSDAWSDYGLQPLWNILDEYQENMTAEQVLVLVNRCLDVTHQRGDLPSAFIEDGSSSLTKISNESVERKLNESIKVIHNDNDKTWFGNEFYPYVDDNSGIKVIYGVSDFKLYCQKNDTRVIYDMKNNFFVVGDTYNYIHNDIVKILKDNDINLSNYTYTFRTQITDDYEEPVWYDKYRFSYNFGNFIIYTRERVIELLPFFNDLGNYELIDLVEDELYESLISNEEYEGLNRIAGFYWFDKNKFQMLKRKPIGVKKLDPEDNEFDYYHLDDNGLEEDNKARFGIEKMGKKVVCYIESENKQNCLKAKKAIQKKFNNILIDKFQLSWGRNGFEELNESIAYAESNNDDLVNVILKNPTRKELYDNCTAARVVIDTSTGDFYFCAANDFIHDQMIDKIGVGSNDSIFYDYYENTFYIRDEWQDEEELEEFYNENKGWLSAYPYIQKNMPNFKLKMMDIYGPETPWD